MTPLPSIETCEDNAVQRTAVHRTTEGARHLRRSPIAVLAITGVFIHGLMSVAISDAAAAEPARAPEEIYVLRSIREPHAGSEGWCSSARTGFEPFATDAERFFSLWSVVLRPADGRVVQTQDVRVGQLRGCFGPTGARVSQNFYAEGSLGAITFRGIGECVAIRTDFPEAGLFAVRCQLVIDGLPAPYAGGLLTTNTLTSQAAFGGDTKPAGYTQASIATIRLWKPE